MDIDKYYGANGSYLNDHRDYFSDERLFYEVGFIIKSLDLDKNDKILDLACGDGRHTIELKKRGYNIDGVDFSDHLIGLAKKNAKEAKLNINFFVRDVHKLNLLNKYDKEILFFSEFGQYNHNLALKNIYLSLTSNGQLLLDIDSIPRLTNYLESNPDSSYSFNKDKSLLSNKESDEEIKYFTLSQITKLFIQNRFTIFKSFGNYNGDTYNDSDSKRLIVVAQKDPNKGEGVVLK